MSPTSPTKLKADLWIRGAAEVATVRGPGDAGVVPRGAVAACQGRVVWVGPDSALETEVDLVPAGRTVDAAGGAVVPGLCDAHTHLVFAGQRAPEFALRWAGRSYLEILAQGGGIHSTVAATRAASDGELRQAAQARLERMRAHGVTTVEVKSGYGLSLDHELRLLSIARSLGGPGQPRISPTLLAAHALPAEFQGGPAARQRYLDLIVEEMIPRAARGDALGPLCEAVDVFLEEGAFLGEEAARIAAAARRHGLGVTLHAGQFTDQGGAELAAQMGARSCDHLEAVSPEGIRALARGGVTAVLLPGAMVSLGLSRPPARALLDAGVAVALATDCNPGSSMTESLPLMMFFGVTLLGMSVEEALYAVTRAPARALGRADTGHLEPGARADLVILDAPSWIALAYHFGGPLARTVFRDGEVIYSR